MTTAEVGATDGVAAASDLEALRRLSHEYCRAVDLGRLDDLMELWAADAVWDASEFGMAAVVGGEAIRAFYEGLVANTTHRFHAALNHMIDVDGDTARATVYVHAFIVSPEGAREESLGYYDDDYVRTAEGWRFQRRAVHSLLPPPPPPV